MIGAWQGCGGRRDDSRDAAILGAALAVLAEVGCDHLTMDRVAARAHAGKGALYRRWPSKADLVIEAVKLEAPRLEVPDTGSLKGDLAVLMRGPKCWPSRSAFCGWRGWPRPPATAPSWRPRSNPT